MSFIVGIFSVGDVGSGVLLFIAARDEGGAFEAVRRPGRRSRSMEDELGVMGASKTPGKARFVGVCDDGNEVSRARETVRPSGDVEGETRALGFGISCVCAIFVLQGLPKTGLCYCAVKREETSS